MTIYGLFNFIMLGCSVAIFALIVNLIMLLIQTLMMEECIWPQDWMELELHYPVGLWVDRDWNLEKELCHPVGLQKVFYFDEVKDVHYT